MKKKLVSTAIVLAIIILVALRFFYPVRLIVRGDDMGLCHEASTGCLHAHQEGILTCVEVMVPAPGFLEAARMLHETTDLDIGIHLTLTCEWESIHWAPLTCAPSLTDSTTGAMYARIWPDPDYPQLTPLSAVGWNYREVEDELRAQIETGLRHLPRCSHLTPHMTFPVLSPAIRHLCVRLAREYGLTANLRLLPVRQVELTGDQSDTESAVRFAVGQLQHLNLGIYEIFTHPMFFPGNEIPEYYSSDTCDFKWRMTDAHVLMSRQVRDIINQKHIQLTGYSGL